MNFRIATLALALAKTSSAIKITSTDALNDIGNAFNDAYDWTKGAVNDAGDWAEGAANDIADFAKDNQDWLIDAGESVLPIGMYVDMFGDTLYSGVEDLVEEEEEEEFFDALYDAAINFGADIGTEVAEVSTEELIEMAILAAAA